MSEEETKAKDTIEDPQKEPTEEPEKQGDREIQGDQEQADHQKTKGNDSNGEDG